MLNIVRLRQNVPAKLENNATFCIPEHVVVHRHEDGLVLLDSAKGLVLTANRTAATIWEGISRGRTVEDVAVQLSMESGLPRERILEDTTKYLLELQQRGLVSAGARG